MRHDFIDLTADDRESRDVLISIDIGVKNFATCVVDLNSRDVVEWTRLPINNKSKSVDDMATAVSARMAEFTTRFRVVAVVVEDQPWRTGPAVYTCRTNQILEASVLAYCRGKDINVSIVDPKSVRRHFGVEIGASKVVMKNLALDHIKSNTEPYVTEELREYFAGESKKDDLADCLNQARYQLSLHCHQTRPSD